MSSASVLVVDDSVEMARLLGDQLRDAGYSVTVAGSGADALTALKRSLPDLVITDLRMQHTDGFDVLQATHAADPGIPVLIMTAFGAIDTAVEAIKRGAYHYLTKPFQLEEVLVFVARALKERQLRDENRALRRVAAQGASLDGMVGRSRRMKALFELVERVAPSDAPVLIRGESGTGKELVARALHFQGPRRERPFIAVNCTALPESLLESELFGHVKGAFTSATGARRGLFSEADGGTLFLDEIGDMSPALQAKLLRAIEEGEVRAVGADSSRRVDVRVIAATHQDLEERIRTGAFRADLFYRLNVVPIVVPPLRTRPEDIPLLVEHFLAQARARNPHSRVERFSPLVVSALARHTWSGNVRELENVVERLVIVSGGAEVGMAELQAQLDAGQDAHPLATARQAMIPLKQLENEYIAWVVAQCGGNKTRAAEVLGIDVSTIHRRER
ncbi:MAG: sigma-54 dependent transcriptional regulator [Myxococcota bacterium]